MTDPRELRAGNSERDAVVTRLQQAYADGRLGEDELRERIDSVHGARTFGDLDALVADLPIPPPSQEFAPSRTDAPPTDAPWPQLAHGPVGTSPENPMILEGGFSAARRQGQWEIPQFLRLRGGMGSIVLDCTEATTTHNTIHLWIEGDLGTISVIVPDGWAADVEGLRKSWGSIRVHVPDAPTMGRPTLVVNGSMGAGSFTVRNPNWFERRRLEKRLR